MESSVISSKSFNVKYPLLLNVLMSESGNESGKVASESISETNVRMFGVVYGKWISLHDSPYEWNLLPVSSFG